jgi:hypothetical protein
MDISEQHQSLLQSKIAHESPFLPLEEVELNRKFKEEVEAWLAFNEVHRITLNTIVKYYDNK